MTREEKVQGLLARYVEAQVVDGVSLDPEELCKDDPELVDTLRARISLFKELDDKLSPPRELNPGSKVLHYRVEEKLGEGGMGQVYLAHDTKLDRKVALKVLPPEMATSAERFQRFRREARLLAALNHPNIAQIYEQEESEGLQFLVLELVPGKTLAERIARRPLPVGEALDLFEQIAEALEAAHAKGILHRDLKPANIKVTPEGTVKVLDFGLAKALARDASSDEDISKSPTVTRASTEAGVILGTAAYMSPEQARGETVDKRTDIWAFGCCLYETLTGQQAFGGKTVTDILAAIVNKEPDWEALPPGTPLQLKDLLRRCLRKDARQRLRDIGDVRLVMLEWVAGTSSQAGLALPVVAKPATSGRLTIIGTATLVVGALLGAIATWSVVRPEPQPVRRFSVNLSSVDRFSDEGGGNLALSPDGGNLVYVGTRGETDRLYLHPMDQLEGTPMKGTEGALSPFFSPNGEWVGFAVHDERLQWPFKLMKAPLAGGAPRLICESCGPDASWASDDTIVFEAGWVNEEGLMRVGADGGAPEQLLKPDPAKGEQAFFPEILPGEQAVLFTIDSADNAPRIVVQSLETGERTDLVQGIEPHYVKSGHIVFAEGSSLLAVPFDVDRLRTTGAAIPVVEGVQMSGIGAHFAVSNNDTLVYKAGTVEAGDPTWMGELVWVDREGVERPLTENEGTGSEPRLSPDGQRLAVTKVTESAGWNVWVLELDRDSFNKLTFSVSDQGMPIWTPDGKHVLFVSGTPVGNVFSVPSDGSGGEPVQLTTSEFPTTACSWSPDGALAVVQSRPDTGWDIGILRVGDEGEPEILVGTRFNEVQPTFSPDGRWLAYTSDESGQPEVYVRPFPGPGRKSKISTDGGSSPLWAPSGGELFYRQGDKVLAVPISTGSEFKPGIPVPLFEGRYRVAPLKLGPCLFYDVARDGQQFVMLRAVEEQSEPRQLSVVLNWFEELKRLVPTN